MTFTYRTYLLEILQFLIHPLKCRHTFRQIITIDATLEILLPGKGLTAMYVCVRAILIRTMGCNTDCQSHVFLDLYKHCPQYLATLKLSPHQQNPEIKSCHSEISRKYGIIKDLLSCISGERACNGHSMYVDNEILKIAQMFNEQASTSTFVPGLWRPTAKAKVSLY